MWKPSEAFTSWTVIRIRSPNLRTLPSTMFRTPRIDPICAIATSFPLNEQDEVRATTLKSSMRARAFINSSANPSQKYSASSCLLRWANGRTAIEAFDGSTPGLVPNIDAIAVEDHDGESLERIRVDASSP